MCIDEYIYIYIYICQYEGVDVRVGVCLDVMYNGLDVQIGQNLCGFGCG